MIKEIGSYKFPGFYESLFCNCDEFLDDESEMKFEVERLIQSKDFFVEYEYEDFNKYKIDVCNTFYFTHLYSPYCMVPTKGFEPLTYSLRMSCSTN